MESGTRFLMAVPPPPPGAGSVDEVEGVLDHGKVCVEAYVDDELGPVAEPKPKLADLNREDHSGVRLDDRDAFVLSGDDLAAEAQEPSVDPEHGIGWAPNVRR